MRRLVQIARLQARFSMVLGSLVIIASLVQGPSAARAAVEVCGHPSPGALAWWPLDGPSDPTLEHIDGNALRMIDGPTAAAGSVDGALSFDRNYAEAQTSLRLGDGDFSIEAWVRTTQTASTGTLIDQRIRKRPDVHTPPPHHGSHLRAPAPSNASEPSTASRVVFNHHIGYSLFLYQGRPGLQLADGRHTNIVSSRSIADGRWHHVMVTVDRDAQDGIRWYVDGLEVLPRGNPTARSGSLDNPGPLRLGMRSFEAAGFFDGALDEVVIHGRALTADEAVTAASAPRCKTSDTAASCAISEIVPTEPELFQSVDFIGFVEPEPGCFFSWTWTVDGQVIAHTPSVNSYSGLSQGAHTVCLQVTDDCSPIGCLVCRVLEVVEPTSFSGTFCGRSAEAWLADHADGKANIINEMDSGRQQIFGTAERDLILGNDRGNTIEGRGGDDCIYGFGGNDSIHGDRTGLELSTSGRDEIHGGDGNDHLEGDAGDDRLFGDTGHDYLEGDAGADLLIGGTGNDRLHGDSGNDDLRGEQGADCLVGDSGNDHLRGGPDNDDLKGDSGRDVLDGGPGRDALKGDSGRDDLHGGPGNDLLKGDSSGDRLWGDAGNDRLCGDGSGWKRDELDGGSGTDGCRSGRKSSCERKLKKRDCQTQDWRDWNANIRCP